MHSAQAADYRRDLDMSTGIVRVGYRMEDARFTREVFVSHPDQVMVIRLTCDKPGQFSGIVTLDSPHTCETVAVDDHTLRMFGQMGSHAEGGLLGKYDGQGLKFEARVCVRSEGGSLSADGDAIDLQQADALTLIYTAATSYKNCRDISGDPAAICQGHIEAAAGKTYEALRDAHVADYRKLFDRVSIDLGGVEAANKPIGELTEATIRSSKGEPCTVRYNGKVKQLRTQAGQCLLLDDQLLDRR